MSIRRNTELALLFAAALPVLVLFALLGTQHGGVFTWTYLMVPGSLLALFACAHLALRKLAPGADPVLLPATFLLSGVGLAYVQRLTKPAVAQAQVLWLVGGLAALIVVLLLVRSLETLGHYKYLLMLVGIVLLIAPAVIGKDINGSRLWIVIGNFSIQPGEVARVLIILFLAAYLAQNREMLSISTRRFLGVTIPEPRTLAPLILMWGVSLVILIAERDLGSSLLFFGIFLVMIYAATGRLSYVLIGLLLFGAGAVSAYYLFGHVQIRVEIWLHPFKFAQDTGYQLVQSLYALAGGGLFGTGPAQGLATRIPAVSTDFIFASIGEELGLIGAVALLGAYLVIVYRGLSTAARAKSDMAAFTAVGLTASLGLQVFVIVGGVTRLIPLTGITLPFISRGGSSMLSTFILLALLLRASDETTGAETEMKSTGGALSVLGRVSLSKRLSALAVLFSLLTVALITNLTWIQVVDARALNNHPGNTRNLIAESRNPRGQILSSDNVVLATSQPTKSRTDANASDVTIYKRSYPKGAYAAHLLGYYSTIYGRTGLESSQNDTLVGKRNFASWKDVVDSALGRPVPGNDLVLTLNSKVQNAAESSLGSQTGAVVVFNPRTGAVLASTSHPDYNPNTVEKSWEQLQSNATAPLLDRSRQTLLAPGSTFKVVTLTGAYASGAITDADTFSGPGGLDIGNAPVTNFDHIDYGTVSAVTALQKSVNTVFGQIAVKLGPNKLVSQSESFGFNRTIPFDLQVKTSLMPNPAQMTTWETAWAGVGQPVGEHSSPAGPQATVYQMGLVACAIANDGVIMRPHVVDRISAAHNAKLILGRTTPQRWTIVCDSATAAQVTTAMIAVVNGGTGAGAKIPGVQVAGKTGTAEVGKSKPTNSWFIGFAPADNPQVAIAILLVGQDKNAPSAAPMAATILKTALDATASSATPETQP
ncbi:MAG: FtsW/RodA/SpoVE family cell cycle protein [Actinomycetia bacterium]|nr:FtsW/RodA/SpoVE family cell cycle protein [Actinomycetes bacterium]